jgi:hypothetical protein
MPATQDASAEKLSREYLISHARGLAGVSRYVLAGALATKEGDEFSGEEAKAAVEESRKREIDPYEGIPEVEREKLEEQWAAEEQVAEAQAAEQAEEPAPEEPPTPPIPEEEEPEQ